MIVGVLKLNMIPGVDVISEVSTFEGPGCVGCLAMSPHASSSFDYP